MEETITNFGENNSLVGILTKSINNTYLKKDICVIFINAGLLHKIGPNGLYVKIARNLALNGVPSFRFDFSGIGDSKNSSGREAREKLTISEIQMAMKNVTSKTGIDKFILLGICSGATDAFKVSLIDEHIVGLVLIDGLYEEPEKLAEIFTIASRNCAIRYYKKHFFNINRWLKVLKGKSNILRKKNIEVAFKLGVSNFKRLFTKIFLKQALHGKHVDEIKYKIDAWLSLLNKNFKIYLIFSEGSSMADIFNLTIAKQLKDLKKDTLKIDYIKDVDHTFTPVWSQNLLTSLICNWI